MAGSVNKVIIVGNLGADPEVRTFDGGGRVCNLRVATSESWKDKASGERKERTEWHQVVIRNDNLIDVADRYTQKGTKVYIEGQLQTRKYQKDGEDRYVTEVVVAPFRGELNILGGGVESGGDRDDDRGSSRGRSDDRGSRGRDSDRGSSRGRSDDRGSSRRPDSGSRSSSSRYELDDDIPF